MLISAVVVVGRGPGGRVVVIFVLILWSWSSRPVGSRSCNVHEEWRSAIATILRRVLNELNCLSFDNIGEVVLLIIIAVCFFHSIIGYRVVVEFTVENTLL